MFDLTFSKYVFEKQDQNKIQKLDTSRAFGLLDLEDCEEFLKKFKDADLSYTQSEQTWVSDDGLSINDRIE